MAERIDAHDELERAHPEYIEHVEEWSTIEDLCQGSRCVKERGTEYLPKLSGQSDNEYRAFRARATFFNATGRTREALAGMILRKKPAIEPGGIPETALADVTLTGEDVFDYARKVAESGVSKGRAGTFVDWNDEEKAPYLSFYQGEDVLNWASSRIDGREVLTMLVLREIEDYAEEFEVSRRKRIRRYWLTTANLEDSDEENDEIGSRLYCETWIEDTDEGGKTTFVKDVDAYEIKRRGITLDRIPFVFHNATHLGSRVGKAPLFDIAELNVSHYRTSADLENGRHFCGLPTPYATGVDENVKEFKIGSESAWLIENESAKVGFLEFQGTGLGELTKALEEKEAQMSKLGARLLFDTKKDAEAFETHALRANSEGSALGHIASTASVTMTEVLQWLEWWGSSIVSPRDSNASFTFSTDFVGSTIQPQLLDSLLKAYVSGSMSFEAFFFNLQKGELFPDDWDLERELAAINAAQNLPGPSRTDPMKQPGSDPDDDDDDEEEEEDDPEGDS